MSLYGIPRENESLGNTYSKRLTLRRIWPISFEAYIYIPLLQCSETCPQKTVSPADNILIRISKIPAVVIWLVFSEKPFLPRKLIRANYSNQFSIYVSVAIVCGFCHGRVKNVF